MKRGSDEGKIMGPMFPRLHVNDTDKGGPRAPPRNKMALYEQLSIPTQRFRPPISDSNSEYASAQGVANERSMFFSYRLPNRHHPEESDLSAPLTPVCWKKKSDEDDFRVPIFNHSDMEQEKNHPLKFHILERAGMVVREEGKRCQTLVNSKEFASDQAKKVSNSSSIEKQRDSSICSEPRDQRNSCDLGNETERAGSVSEISVVESIAGPDTTPDDAVGIIGQKHFWEARKAILNQQRVFAVQVFELHRLVKVQRLIAESPNSLVENSAFINHAKAIPKQRGQVEKPSQNGESSAENTTGKASLSSIQNAVLPLARKSPAPSLSSDPNAGPWVFNQPQWLIPVMTPSEGLVYKPYPGPGFAGPPGPNPAYGIAHHQMPSFPPAGFPTYGLSSSIEQTNPRPSHKNRAFREETKSLDEVVEADRASSHVEDSRGSIDNERGNVLSLFPMAPFSDEPRDLPTQAIKVMPHNARSATESAARIFRSIQEERKQL